jgi:enoyl-CoA hydratase/carnithine racemase
MPSDILLRQDIGPVARLTLNRPAARNALSLALMAGLEAELDAIDAHPAVRAVIIAGAGSAFCAGHDLREMHAENRPAAHAALFEACSRLMQRIVSLRCPVIAQVHGIATAAGCQLVATCDLAIAADDARFATPGVNIGLFCSTPMVALSRAVGRKAAMAMLLTGETVDAAEAQRIGLVNRVVAAADLQSAAGRLAAAVADKSGAAVALGKRAFYQQAEMGLADAYAFASGVMAANMGLPDAAEGISAFLGKRDPVWAD